MTLATWTLSDAGPADLNGIVALDALRDGPPKPAYWGRILDRYGGGADDQQVALVARNASGLVVGFLFGEVRAWEFGSEPCGWIFSVAVHPICEREGLATRLCEEALRRFRGMGVTMVLTMVRREDVPLLALFRSLDFAAGPFDELERPLQPQPVRRARARRVAR